ncbi:hypothetical protein [Sphaerisporangium corydalis]|uniref:ABC transporter permease n=1 Tax=Sphaerisporangium corydalis TaxID=1441875 RepID=A0ABV9ELA3_9ACTN|nr:hypothetical protein [Sphaerisporangium corydalis]
MAIVWASIRTHLRQQGLSPVAWLLSGLFPIALAYVARQLGREADLRLVAGVSAAAMIDTAAALVVLTVLSERQWGTLRTVAGTTRRPELVLVGRLCGVLIQTLTVVPVTYAFVSVAWGLVPVPAPAVAVAGALVLAAGVVIVMMPLVAVLVRFRYHPGMTNGIPAVILAFTGALVPLAQLPSLMRACATVLPSAWAIEAVGSGQWRTLGYGVAVMAGWALLGGVLLVLVFRRLRLRPDAFEV